MAVSVYSAHCSTGRRAMKPFSSFLLDSQIFTPGRLISVTDRDDMSPVPARRGRQPVALVGGVGCGACGFGLVNQPPGVLGDIARPNYVGPSGNGLVERMKAGETPWNQGRSNGRPCPFPEGGPEDEGKTPQWSAERRAGPRYGPAIPSADGIGSIVRSNQWARRSAPANFGAPLPSVGGAKGSKPTIWHDSPPGCAARQRSRTGQTHSQRRTVLRLENQTSAGISDARLLRGACHRAGQRPDPLARNDTSKRTGNASA